VRLLVAWRLLAHEKGRGALAVAGISVAVMLVFMQLGFFSSVPRGSMTIYDALRYDIAIVSSEYAFELRGGSFPRRRLEQARALGEVASVAPLYQGEAYWLSREDRKVDAIFIIAFDPKDRVFAVPDIEAQAATLRRPDTVLVDDASKPIFGPHARGRIVEIAQRRVEIGGSYRLGLGFLGDGVVVTSDQNFLRLFPNRPLDHVGVGLVRLRPGTDPAIAARRLREILPVDVNVFTRAAFADRETRYWVGATSTGLIFGSGVVVAVVVGAAILFQILSAQIARNLREYATLKAIGYTDRALGGIVVCQALIMAAAAFAPAFPATLAGYAATRAATQLPIFMTAERLALVALATAAMAIGAALLALRGVRRADPAELM
jgi:putative ABC transport system permease protein